MDEERIISPELENRTEERLENSLRPTTLREYIGQDKVKENMKIYIEAAKKRKEAKQIKKAKRSEYIFYNLHKKNGILW